MRPRDIRLEPTPTKSEAAPDLVGCRLMTGAGSALGVLRSLAGLVGEVVLERAPVDLPPTGARHDAHAGDRLLAPTGGGTGRGGAGTPSGLAGDRTLGLGGVLGQLDLVAVLGVVHSVDAVSHG